MTHRFQVWLTDQQYEALNAEANRTGLPMGELVRRMIDRVLRAHARPKLKGIELSVGVWRRPDAAVAARRPGIKLRD